MSRWWRAYDEAVDDPKLQKLPGELFKAWFNLCCITSQNGGVLPPIEDVAFKLRTSVSKAKSIVDRLVELELIDETDGNFAPHNWDARQFKSDVKDPTAPERMRKYRKNKKGVTESVTQETVTQTVTVTPPRTDTEQNRTEDAADAAPKKYFFEAGCIRLNEKDFRKWEEAFTHLQLKAELLSLQAWADGQGSNWFHAVAGALAKRNRQIASEQRRGQSSNRLEGIV